MIRLKIIKYPRKYLNILIPVLYLVSQISVVNSTRSGKVIQILQGDVRGRTSVSRGGRLFTEYFGIPYANSPQRFELARPGPSWEGIRECSKKPPTCMFQTDEGHIQGSEDCLFLNVHTPQTHDLYYARNLPVIVIIHGGFEPWADSSSHFLGAKYFMDKEVILVSLNYRLGAFGFFTTQDETMHANLGLKDQVLALRWVQKNIQFFGGCPNSVTLLGYGAGAASAHYHMMSRMSRGLFSKVIAQSGSALSPWAFVDDPEKSFSAFVTNMKCDSDLDSKAVVECLRGKSAVEIVQETYRLQYMFAKDRSEMGNAVFFGPVIEHWMRNYPEIPCFLHDYPQNILANAEAENITFVPLLTGVNQYDGVTKQFAEVVNRQTSLMVETKFKIQVDYSIKTLNFGNFFGYRNKIKTAPENKKIDTAVDTFYFKPLGKKWIGSDDGMTFFQALSHRNYFQGTRKMAVTHAKYASNVFLYYISYFRGTTFLDYWYRGFSVKYDLFKRKRTTLDGPCNGDELQYLFDLDEMGEFPMIRKKYREMSLGFSMNLVLLWVNFAKTGIPEANWEPLPQGASITSLQWYHLGDERLNMDEPFRVQVNFWDDLLGHIVYVLPPLKPKNETQRHRKGTSRDGSTEDIIYVDGRGDDDGTGGLFEYVGSNKKNSKAKKPESGSSEDSNSIKPSSKTKVEKSESAEDSEPKSSENSKPETSEPKSSENSEEPIPKSAEQDEPIISNPESSEEIKSENSGRKFAPKVENCDEKKKGK